MDPRIVADPAQIRAIFAQVRRIRPQLTAFYGCLYYAALRPEEAVALHRDCCQLPAAGWGTLTISTTAPRTAAAWTTTGTSHEPRGLKQRPHGAVRAIPIPPELVRLLRDHLRVYGTAADGRLFRGTRGGMLSESAYGRTWHTARDTALGPDLAATVLARRPYDLRHAALSLWLSAGVAPAEAAARAGTSVAVLHAVYTHRLPGHDQTASTLIEHALATPADPPPGTPRSSRRTPTRAHSPRTAPGQSPPSRRIPSVICPRHSRTQLDPAGRERQRAH